MNLKLFAAIFFLSFGAVVYMIGKPKLSKEFQALETAQAWNGGGQPQESELLLLTGAIAASQDSIWDGFVVANRELFTGTGKLNGWKVDKAFLNPFYLKAEKGMVKVQLKEVPDRGTQLVAKPLEERTDRNRHIRMKGLKTRGQLSLIGNYNVATNTFEATYAYAGYVEAYTVLLEEGALIIHQIIIVLLCIGFVFLGWHFWSKKNTKQVQ